MAQRILTWRVNGIGETLGEVYYMERDYIPLHVRIYSRIAPVKGDLEVDIKDDGETIFGDYAILGQGENGTAMAEDFLTDIVLEEGSWVSLDIVDTGGANEFTVHLELESLTEDEELEDE